MFEDSSSQVTHNGSDTSLGAPEQTKHQGVAQETSSQDKGDLQSATAARTVDGGFSQRSVPSIGATGGLSWVLESSLNPAVLLFTSFSPLLFAS